MRASNNVYTCSHVFVIITRHAGVPVESVVSMSGVLHPLISLPHYSHSQHSDDHNETKPTSVFYYLVYMKNDNMGLQSNGLFLSPLAYY